MSRMNDLQESCYIMQCLTSWFIPLLSCIGTTG